MRIPLVVASLLVLFTQQDTVYGRCLEIPVAVDDQVAIAGPPVHIDALANDTEPDGLPLALSVSSTTCPGTAVADSGAILLTLSGSLAGPCTITYSASNGTFSDTATVTVTLRDGLFRDNFEGANLDRWSSVDP